MADTSVSGTGAAAASDNATGTVTASSRGDNFILEKTQDRTCTKCQINFQLVKEQWKRPGPKGGIQSIFYVAGHEDNKWCQRNWNSFCQLNDDCKAACKQITQNKLRKGKISKVSSEDNGKQIKRIKPNSLSKKLASIGFRAMKDEVTGLAGSPEIQRVKRDIKLIVHVSVAGEGTTYTNFSDTSAFSEAAQVFCGSYMAGRNSFIVPSIQGVSNF